MRMDLSELHAAGTPLQDWLMANDPTDDMLWKKSYWAQAIFVRDTLHRYIAKSYDDSKDNPVMVVSTHRSKSILLPVYSIQSDGLSLILRDNFYNWQVSVKADAPVRDNFYGLFDKSAKKIEAHLCEGFPTDCVFGSYDNDPSQFTVTFWGGDYELFTFVYLLTRGRRGRLD